jgi:hypothetical protein
VPYNRTLPTSAVLLLPEGPELFVTNDLLLDHYFTVQLRISLSEILIQTASCRLHLGFVVGYVSVLITLDHLVSNGKF